MKVKEFMDEYHAEEAYLAFEDSKKLRDIGYHGPSKIVRFISDKGKISGAEFNIPICCAMNWLRMAKGLIILPDYNRLMYWPKPYYFHIYTATGDNGGRDSDKAPIDPYYNYMYKTYEQACEAAIKYCLENLIKEE